MRKLLAALAFVAVAPACGGAAARTGGEPSPEHFSAELDPVNGSNVEGAARLTLSGRSLTVRIDARGLEPDRIHGQHIQSLAVAGEPARCADDADDDDGDGLVRLSEAMGSWGRSVRALEPFPTVGGDGRLHYDLTLRADPKKLEPLENRLLVLRGRSVPNGDGDDQYLPDLPVACGELRQVDAKGV